LSGLNRLKRLKKEQTLSEISSCNPNLYRALPFRAVKGCNFSTVRSFILDVRMQLNDSVP